MIEPQYTTTYTRFSCWLHSFYLATSLKYKWTCIRYNCSWCHQCSDNAVKHPLIIPLLIKLKRASNYSIQNNVHATAAILLFVPTTASLAVCISDTFQAASMIWQLPVHECIKVHTLHKLLCFCYLWSWQAKDSLFLSSAICIQQLELWKTCHTLYVASMAENVTLQ